MLVDVRRCSWLLILSDGGGEDWEDEGLVEISNPGFIRGDGSFRVFLFNRYGLLFCWDICLKMLG